MTAGEQGEKFIRVNTEKVSRRVHLREDGPVDGPVLLLIHGFSGSLKWLDPLADELADEYRVVRLDLLGHGATGGAAADAPVQADMVEALLAALDIGQLTVLGHSFGADVAVELAQRSQRVERVVVLAQGPDYTDAVLPRGSALMTIPVLSTALHRAAVTVGTVLSAVLGALRNRRVRDGLATQALHDFRALDVRMFRIVLVERRDRLARRPLDVQLRETGKPALVVLGGRDHFYGARAAGRYEQAGAIVAVLPDSGHSPHLEAPEVVARLIREFHAPRPATTRGHENASPPAIG